MLNVLVVENDQKLISQYCAFLEKQGYAALQARDAAEALRSFESSHVDIVLCNAQLPGIDGVMVVEALRDANPDLPIIIASTSNELRSKQRAFQAGCDDYLVMPVDLNELSLRISALLRRAHAASKLRVTIGNAELDSSSFTVIEGPNTTVLPPKEFMLLFKLCSSPDRIFTRRDIMNDIWGIHVGSGERTVDVHVKRLRKRFAESESFRIETVRGVGYKVTAIKQEKPNPSES